MYRNNWAGNITFNADKWNAPASIAELQEIVAKTDRVRAVGTRHSFSEIANSQHTLVSMEHLNRIISLDKERLSVTVEAGIRYGELGQYLNNHGFALHNLASLVHIGVVGACATATHGSGLTNGNLSTAVSGIEMLKPDGTCFYIDRDDDVDMFEGLVVGLGVAGIVSKIRLDIEPAFQVQQTLYENLPFSAATTHFEEIMGAAYSVSLFTNWADDTINQVWLKHRVDGALKSFPMQFFDARQADGKRHPVAGFSSESCTDQMAKPGWWHERLQHFRIDFTPSAGEELQSEFILPLDAAVPALTAIKLLGPKISPLLYTSEIRTVASDKLWLSSAYQQPSVCIHFTWKPDWAGVKPVLKAIENALAPFGVRPHWGKITTLKPEYIRAQYPMLSKFMALRDTLDPLHKFENAFTKRLLE